MAETKQKLKASQGKRFTRYSTKAEKDTLRETAKKGLQSLELLTDADTNNMDYRPEYAALAAVIVSVYGSTPSELAKVFGVGPSFIEAWMQRHSDFRDAVVNAAQNTNIRVMDRLFRQTQGYRYTAEKVFYDGKRGRVVKTEYQEYVKPDTSAMVFWLKNRMPDKWQDKVLTGPADAKGLAQDLKNMFDQTVTPDAALDTYQKLLEIEAEAVKVEPETVYFTPKREKPSVERPKATDADVIGEK